MGAQSDDENARRHFESGAAYLQQSDYDNALREFQSAYALSKRPALLLNIATVYERLGKLREAVETLGKYLAEDPKSAERTTIETRIGNLKKRIDAQAAAAPPPVASAAPSTPASAAVAPLPAPSGSVAPVAPEPPPVPATLPPNRTPAYISLGVAGAAAVAAGITGILAKSKFDENAETCKPNCSSAEVDSVKSMALISTALTGVAVLGAGVGAALFFTAKPREAARAKGPWISAGAGPAGAGVAASWAF